MYCKTCGTLLQNGTCPKCGACGNGGGGSALAILAVIPAFLLALVFLIAPFFKTLLLSMKNYSPARGIFGSAWVGFQNFSKVTEGVYFSGLLGNTFLQGMLCLLAGAVVVFLLTGCAAFIKNKWLRCGFLSIILLPVILPMHLFVTKILPMAWLMSPAWYRLVPVLNEMLRIAPLAVLAGSFALSGGFAWKRVWFVTLCYAGLRLALLLFPDMQMQLATYNPAVYETADVLSTFSYRTGMMNADYSSGAAVYILQLVLNLLPWLAGCIGLLMITGSHGRTAQRLNSNQRAAVLPAGIIGASVLAIVVGVLLSLLATFFLRMECRVFGSILFSAACCLAAAVFALGLAYPMIAGNGMVSAVALVLGLFLLPLCSNWMGLSLHTREMQMINTLWGVLFQNATWGILAAFGLAAAADGRRELDGKAFALRILPPAIAFLGIGFCFFYTDAYLYPLLFLNDKTMYPLTMILREILVTGGAAMSAEPMPPALSRLLSLSYLVPAVVGLAGIWIGTLTIQKEK